MSSAEHIQLDFTRLRTDGSHIATDTHYAVQFAHEVVTGDTGGGKSNVRRQDRQVHPQATEWLSNVTNLPLDALYPVVLFPLSPAVLQAAEPSGRGKGQSLRIPKEMCDIGRVPLLTDFLQSYFSAPDPAS